MVAKQQEINDPGTKHPGNEEANYEESTVLKRVGYAFLVLVAFVVLLYFLGGLNVIH